MEECTQLCPEWDEFCLQSSASEDTNGDQQTQQDKQLFDDAPAASDVLHSDALQDNRASFSELPIMKGVTVICRYPTYGDDPHGRMPQHCAVDGGNKCSPTTTSSANGIDERPPTRAMDAPSTVTASSVALARKQGAKEKVKEKVAEANFYVQLASMMISTHHALIHADGCNMWFEDLQSANGSRRTSNSSMNLVPFKMYELTDQTELHLAGMRLKLLISRDRDDDADVRGNEPLSTDGHSLRSDNACEQEYSSKEGVAVLGSTSRVQSKTTGMVRGTVLSRNSLRVTSPRYSGLLLRDLRDVKESAEPSQLFDSTEDLFMLMPNEELVRESNAPSSDHKQTHTDCRIGTTVSGNLFGSSSIATAARVAAKKFHPFHNNESAVANSYGSSVAPTVVDPNSSEDILETAENAPTLCMPSEHDTLLITPPAVEPDVSLRGMDAGGGHTALVCVPLLHRGAAVDEAIADDEIIEAESDSVECSTAITVKLRRSKRVVVDPAETDDEEGLVFDEDRPAPEIVNNNETATITEHDPSSCMKSISPSGDGIESECDDELLCSTANDGCTTFESFTAGETLEVAEIDFCLASEDAQEGDGEHVGRDEDTDDKKSDGDTGGGGTRDEVASTPPVNAAQTETVKVAKTDDIDESASPILCNPHRSVNDMCVDMDSEQASAAAVGVVRSRSSAKKDSNNRVTDNSTAAKSHKTGLQDK
eukprot:Lankesteria_metandrocarpae@DN2035_c0_g1_i1.p2